MQFKAHLETLPLGAVGSSSSFWRGGQKGTMMSPGVWYLAAQVPHPLLAPFPQPYPCAEDEECSTDEYCASSTRGAGAGAQICLSCRKRRKRCMRHAMCCPGNYCKNGESGSFLSDSNHPALVRLQLGDNALSFQNAVASPAHGSSACEVPLKCSG